MAECVVWLGMCVECESDSVWVCLCWVTECMLSVELTECVLSNWSVAWDRACWPTECVCDWPWRRTWWPGTAWWSRKCRWCHWCSHLHWSVPVTRSAPVAEQHKKDDVTNVNTCTDQYLQYDLFQSPSNTKRMSLQWSVPATWYVPVYEQNRRIMSLVLTPALSSTHHMICSSLWAKQKDDVTGINTCIDQYPWHNLFQSLSNTERMSPVLTPAMISTHDTICSSRWATQKGCHWY